MPPLQRRACCHACTLTGVCTHAHAVPPTHRLPAAPCALIPSQCVPPSLVPCLLPCMSSNVCAHTRCPTCTQQACTRVPLLQRFAPCGACVLTLVCTCCGPHAGHQLLPAHRAGNGPPAATLRLARRSRHPLRRPDGTGGRWPAQPAVLYGREGAGGVWRAGLRLRWCACARGGKRVGLSWAGHLGWVEADSSTRCEVRKAPPG